MRYQTYNFVDCLTAQREIAPAVYGELDLNFKPERWCNHLEEGLKIENPDIEPWLKDPSKMEFFRQLTMMGDPFADAVAALMMDKLGMKKGRELFNEVLVRGVDNVPDAPEEIKAFFSHLEHVPEWVDFNKIEKAVEGTRFLAVCFWELINRGGFMGVYENDYQSLPLIISGGLSEKSAAKRIADTSSVMLTSLLPQTLRRDGPAYRLIARVRLMHSMVRISLLRDPAKWNLKVYGMPLPQIDDPSATMLGSYVISKRAQKSGRELNELEKAQLHFFRYLTYLFGVHDYWGSEDPKEIILAWETRHATFRMKKDPQRYIPFVQAAAKCYLRKTHTPWDKFMTALDRIGGPYLYAKQVGKEAAAEYGVRPTVINMAAFFTMASIKVTEFAAVSLIAFLPGGRKIKEKYELKKLQSFLRAEEAVDTNADPTKFKAASSST
ncbi:MAG TPA: hypothetical protein VFM46_07550 [Pseudomonadales bacterium]|nr:hypothetical protein [Pseudomonadales bacterium]